MCVRETEILSYASRRETRNPRISRLALAAILLALAPFVFDGVLYLEWRPRLLAGDFIGYFVFWIARAVIITAVNIGTHAVASGLCFAARWRIAAAPDLYRKRWLATVAALMCYGLLAVEIAAVIVFFYIFHA